MQKKERKKNFPNLFFFVQNLISSLSLPFKLYCVCASTLFSEHVIGFRISTRGISLITKTVLLKPK